MSLVDYAASSDEDEPQNPAAAKESGQVKENPEKRPRFEGPAPAPSSSAPPTHGRISTSLSNEESGILKLPDASFLLNSPNPLNSSDHSSRVAAAVAESSSRKRDLNARSKVPKGPTVGARLLPPQLSGRSNVVTEDISKLFVRKQADSPAE